MPKTSSEWWAEVKADPAKFNAWLIRQHRGEASAYDRIQDFAGRYAPDPAIYAALMTIADEEQKHAGWIQALLESRGIPVDTSGAENRYWSATLPAITSFETGAAVGAHAEAMRLERIRAIVADPEAPEDVRTTFEAILHDEVQHESLFRRLAGPAAMAAVSPDHQRGLELLGLSPE